MNFYFVGIFIFFLAVVLVECYNNKYSKEGLTPVTSSSPQVTNSSNDNNKQILEEIRIFKEKSLQQTTDILEVEQTLTNIQKIVDNYTNFLTVNSNVSNKDTFDITISGDEIGKQKIYISYPIGKKGPMGPTGPQGPTGPTGPTGFRGPTGSKGPSITYNN